MDVLSYQLDSSEQFWDELDDIASGDYHSPAVIERSLKAFIRFASLYLDQYVESDEELTKCGLLLINSTLANKNRAYIRRKLISLIVTKHDMDIATKTVIGTVLLIDGQQEESLFEMMQEEQASEQVIKILWHDRHKSVRLHRIFLELLYGMCKVQKLPRQDLVKVSDDFIVFMFNIIETNDYFDTDPYNYAAMKVLLALNEQYMIIDVGAANSNEMIENRMFKVIRTEGDNYRTFGENLVFLFNRGIDDTIQLMMMKFLYLVFTTDQTSEYIYYNDLKVLVCVMIRELLDLSDDEEKMRHTYLRVLHPLLQNTQLKQDGYKRRELLNLLELFIDPAAYDDTTIRLAERCLNVEWLDYRPIVSSINSSTTSLSSTLINSPSSTSTGSDEKPQNPKYLSVPGAPPMPPPPRKKKSICQLSPSRPSSTPPRPPPPHPRKIMSIRNTSAMDVASMQH